MTRKAPEQQDVVVWVRLPRGTSPKELKKLGIPEVACYGGDTCIAATSADADAGLLIKGPGGENVRQLLKDAGLNPQAACFGGDTCIV